MTDYRDLVIAELANNEGDLIERVDMLLDVIVDLQIRPLENGEAQPRPT